MFESTFMFVAGFLFTWPALALLVTLAVWFDYADWRGTAVFLSLVAMASAYFYFNLTWQQLLYYTAGWLGIGLLCSFWLYKSFVDKQVRLFKLGTSRYSKKESLVEFIKPTRNIPKIVSWIFIWPVSITQTMLQDVIRFVEHLVSTVFRGVYNRIYESAVAALR